MANNQERWYFTKDQLNDILSAKDNMSLSSELCCRQYAASLIYLVGMSFSTETFSLPPVCIPTGIVLMHRFYLFHPCERFDWFDIGQVSLFLACKLESVSGYLYKIIAAAHAVTNRRPIGDLDYLSYVLITHESLLLGTVGCDLNVEHPYLHITEYYNKNKDIIGKEIAEQWCFVATFTLMNTKMCLRYKPTIVACFCIHVCGVWSRHKNVLVQREGWYLSIDSSVSDNLLRSITDEFYDSLVCTSPQSLEYFVSHLYCENL